jgi:hypothetical protein
LEKTFDKKGERMKLKQDIKIELNNKNRISADQYQWILEKLIENEKTGETYWKPTYFYTSIISFFTDMFETQVRDSGFSDMKKLLDNMEDIGKEIISKAYEVKAELKKILKPVDQWK